MKQGEKSGLPDGLSLGALLKSLRENHVFVFRGMGLSIQMSQTAWDAAPRIEPGPLPTDDDVPLSDMPPELAGPSIAAEILRRMSNPTHPDNEIDDRAEQGADLPDDG